MSQKPKPNDNPAIWDLVIDDMKKRDKVGTEEYKTRLQPFNGLNSLMELYHEILDSAAYIRDEIYRRESLWQVINDLKIQTSENYVVSEDGTGPPLAFENKLVTITNRQAKAIISYFEGEER